MSVIGIVCEFNPFHNGHKHLIDSVKADGDIVVCVMSGNFVQRGEPAIFSKEVRVKSALMNGADIVLELPFVYATASAEIFASSAVKILDSFGCDKIVFGTENTTLSQLENTVKILLSDNFDEKIKKHLEYGISYPKARQMAYEEYGCNCDISLPNNILAIEYISAIKKNNFGLTPITVNRMGAGYNDDFAVENFASATHIRNLINENKDFEKYVPDNVYEIYINALEKGEYLNTEKFNISALSILRSIDAINPKIANMAEGLENRIASAIKISSDINEIYDKVKTKRFTHSRIRRAVLSTIMSVTNDDLQIPVPYCRLLGFNTKIANNLGDLAKKCSLPFVVNYSDIVNLNKDDALQVFGLENKSSDLYNLALQKTGNCSTEMTYSVIKMK